MRSVVRFDAGVSPEFGEGLRGGDDAALEAGVERPELDVNDLVCGHLRADEVCGIVVCKDHDLWRFPINVGHLPLDVYHLPGRTRIRQGGTGNRRMGNKRVGMRNGETRIGERGKKPGMREQTRGTEQMRAADMKNEHDDKTHATGPCRFSGSRSFPS